ncbi:MAG: hypothetical protein PF508_08215 [Spirochaeta sp.]|jgi:hypothetical protein|nr:hypothetical protein [Spirochaeta sp.]
MNEVQISQIDGVRYYTISNYDRMAPFFMSLVSSSDHWLFLSSTGGITAGRKNADNALFPYYTDDKIHDSHAHTGPVTLLSVTSHDTVHFWQPFATHVFPCSDSIVRSLHKSVWGNAVIFEEQNRSLGLTFSYRWSFSSRFGIVRSARLRNDRSEPVSIEIVDGLRNVLPAGTDRITQERLSTLLDGYKRSEFIENTKLGIYALSSIITDRAEPSESLLANTVWSLGFPEATVSIDPNVLTSFPPSRAGESPTEVRGRRGAYVHHATFVLENEKKWCVVADVGMNSAAVANLQSYLATHPVEKIDSDLAEEMAVDTDRLRRFVATSDGLQVSGDERLAGRHYTNTLFNIMRGGVFADGYSVSRNEFLRFCRRWNGPVCDRFQRVVQDLPEHITYEDLRQVADRVRATGEPESRNFERIVAEFLPLSFSRRHGDPSRPWNRFSIDLFSPDGTPMIAYQGNWRDIFQNWEALAHSFPLYLEGMISRFVNATTADGYNPYRISQDGIDWEVFDPDDPWSNIGYWNDHQIVYLYRLMKLLNDHLPEVLPALLEEQKYVFADVPYRIKSFAAIIEDPRETIDFDDEREAVIDARVASIGADGKLLHNGDEIVHVSLLEKVLILVLTKIGNLVPGGGIWMNTQRPEWNDANNALVGWGVSIVTVAHLRRFLVFLLDEILPDSDQAVELSEPVARFFDAISGVLASYESRDAATDPAVRYAKVMELGAVADSYRRSVYSGEIGRGEKTITLKEIRNFLSAATRCLDRSIETARRPDGLYHSYNLMHLHNSKIEIVRLPLMLEGQVAVLSAGMLSSTDSAAVVDALSESALYRPDQNSFTLYPDKSLPRFMNKNAIPSDSPETDAVLQRVASTTGDQIVQKDTNGAYHFHADFAMRRYCKPDWMSWASARMIGRAC